jgi:hypothetical protein
MQENICEEMMAKSFPNLLKASQIYWNTLFHRFNKSSEHKEDKRETTQTYWNQTAENSQRKQKHYQQKRTQITIDFS